MSARVESPKRIEIRTFGMWLFLASEAMFFTAFFAMALIMRIAHPELLSPKPLPITPALANSLVMALSLFLMARAAKSAKAGNSRGAGNWLFLTAGTGLLFLSVKVAEYAMEIHEGKIPSTNIFFGCYYTLTGFEGLHVLIGIVVLLVLGWRAKREILPKVIIVPSMSWVFIGRFWRWFGFSFFFSFMFYRVWGR